jgi:pimeloyl-ACP methyl ester carboxylesterase
MHAATDTIAWLAAQAEARRTPCGAGEMVWRRWGTGRPVVLLHGGSGSWMHWIKTIPVLVEAGYEIWAADLPGLGDSAMPPDPPTPESSGKVVAAGVRALIPAERRPHLVAFSFGAHVGTFAAAVLGDHIASFTVCGSAALDLPRDFIKYPKERRGMTEAERRAIHRGTLEALMISKPERIDERAIDIQAANIPKARFKSREFAFTDQIKANIGRVAAPVNAIWGEFDVVSRPEAAFTVLRAARPELESRMIADSGHWVMYEQADAYNKALLELLALRS